MLRRVGLLALLLFVFVAGRGAKAANFSFTRNLTLGARGDDVSALQQFLIDENYLKITASTGYFGPLTRTALGAWQASAGVFPPAGFFGPITMAKISSLAKQILPDLIPPQIPTSTIVTTSTTALPKDGVGLPTRLEIPTLGVNAIFQHLGLKPDGTMEIPNNVFDVAWFTGSPRPGEKGSSIITGHVAQIRQGVLTKPGVFMKLNELRVGDKISVLDDKGNIATFVVRESRLYDPAANATDVFTSSDSGAHLNLITCEGTWNAAAQSYSKRLVMFADLVQ